MTDLSKSSLEQLAEDALERMGVMLGVRDFEQWQPFVAELRRRDTREAALVRAAREAAAELHGYADAGGSMKADHLHEELRSALAAYPETTTHG